MLYDEGYKEGYLTALQEVLMMIEGEVPLDLLKESIEEEIAIKEEL